MSTEQQLTFTISDLEASSRLDQYLGNKQEIGSRTKALFLIENKRVRIAGKVIKPSYKLRTGDVIVVDLPAPQPTTLEKYVFALDIVFEDEDVIVVNKPAGLVVHPAHGHHNDTLVNALLAHTKNLSMRFGEERPGIVHRIDKETSGLLVVAKNDFAHEALAEQFKTKKIKRIYEAVVHGVPIKKTGHMESRLARNPLHRKKFASLKKSSEVAEGKLAITDYVVLQSNQMFSILELKLTTGRTHQIRVHCSEMGHPLVGDTLYGADKKLKKISSEEVQKSVLDLHRFLLHAKTLGFLHPRTDRWAEFEKQWPESEINWMEKWMPQGKK